MSAEEVAPRRAANFKLVLEFDGARFFGWQYQPRKRTVQGEIESALKEVLSRPVTVYGCSRTDAGVSARNYVAGFFADRVGIAGEPGKLRQALNWHLPGEILVKNVEYVPCGFHPRHDARRKTYEYRIVRGRSPLRTHHTWELRFPVEAARMTRALRLFAGHHNFGAFCHIKNEGQPACFHTHLPPAEKGIPGNRATVPNFLCTLEPSELTEQRDEMVVTIRGNRFLYKMVRRIVGAAVAYGAGGITLADIRNALAGRKHQPFRTAPACGLVLDAVDYSEPRRSAPDAAPDRPARGRIAPRPRRAALRRLPSS